MSSRLSLLVDLASLLTREVDLDTLLGAACERMAEALRADRASVWLVDAADGDLVTRVAVLPEVAQLRQPLGAGIAGHVAASGEVVRLADAHADPRFDPRADRATGYRTRSMIVAPIREEPTDPVRGVVQVLNRKDGPFDVEDERYVVALATQLARVLALTTLRAEDAAGPGVTLRGPFNRIVGRSKALDAVYERVALAAQTTATVLLRGETGTGKGLFARAVHVNSERQGKPFVTVDCTTLPAALAESELFGHERGAFTGADRRMPGASRYGRPAPTFEPDALAALRAHAWPGNVRELEHCLESAIVLATDGRVRRDRLPLPAASAAPADASQEDAKRISLPLGLTLDEAARRYAEATLGDCGGHRSAAAARLGIGRNTIARLVKAR